jgi:hypothetical protein
MIVGKCKIPDPVILHVKPVIKFMRISSVFNWQRSAINNQAVTGQKGIVSGIFPVIDDHGAVQGSAFRPYKLLLQLNGNLNTVLFFLSVSGDNAKQS